MLIEQLTPGRRPSLTLDDAVLTIEGVSVDLAARQQDAQVVIDLCLQEDGSIREGMGRAYVAIVMIPPRRYELVAGLDAEGRPTETRQALPLDPNRVQVKLFGLAEPPASPPGP